MIHKHGVSFHLCFNCFQQYFVVFSVQVFCLLSLFLGIFFYSIANGIVFVISFLDCSFLVCGNKTDFFLKRFYLFIFRESGREGREGEKHQCVVTSHMAPTEDLARNTGTCPHWESNRQHFGLRPMLNPLSYTSQNQNLIFLC